MSKRSNGAVTFGQKISRLVVLAAMGDDPKRDQIGPHVKRLREVRALTQEQLAQRSGLAADTIRRLEHQEFSPSLRTLEKTADGLGITLSAMFSTLELDDSETSELLARIHAMLLGRSRADLVVVERLVSELIAGLDLFRRG